MEKQPRYLLSQKSPKLRTRQIARWWALRWLLPRLAKEGILDRVAAHHFIHPIRHGARVKLPSQGDL